ncbi:hypothetical protein AHiyo8_pI66950 (plasmid) [Arthrobacter sp. Hiyo8]|nr:hypothetical protein AHiyo8_pI66950 [Arthrobacter sp. Hiyo8]
MPIRGIWGDFGSETLVQDYTSLGNTLSGALAAAAKENQDELTKKVFACMVNGKYPVDPNGPNKQPVWGVDFGVPLGTQPPIPRPSVSGSLNSTVRVIPAVPAANYVPTQQESESAAAMYQCSIDSGVHTVWVQKMTEAKHAAVAKNETALTEMGPKIHSSAKAAALAVQSQPSS